MSTRRKKTVKEKTPLPTDKGYYVSFDPALMGHYRRGKNPLDDELASEDAMLAHEVKSMRVEEMNLKRRSRMTKLQKEIDRLEKESGKTESDDSDTPRISVAMAQQIANLPPAEREKVIETYALFSSIAKGKGDSMLPLLIGFSKSNPGTPQINMLDYAKAMGDQLKTGIDLAKAFTTKEKPSNAMEFMKVMKDLVIEGVRNPLLQAIEKSQPQPSAFEQILMNPEMFSRAKEIGMFGSSEPKTGSTNIDLEIEKLRGERQLEIKKMDLEWRKSTLEIEAKDRRTDTLLTALGPISAILAGPVSQRMQQFGEQQGATHIPPNVMPREAQTPGTTIVLRCTCGYEGPTTFPGPIPPIIKCPNCGQDLVVGGTAPGENK